MDKDITTEELELVKAVMPKAQYEYTLQLTHGEEGEYFKQKLKDFAELVKNSPGLYKTNGAEQHPIILRYFHPTGTTSLVCEIGKDGQAFGFQCLNDDWEMAEWGRIDLNETKNIPLMELDYHIPEGMTIERWLYQEQSEMFPQYAKFDAEFAANKIFNSVMNKAFDSNKIEHDAYDYAKSRFLDGSISDLKFAEVQKDFYKNTAASELNEILKESPDQEVARLAALRYFNAWADDGLWKENGNLYNLYGILGMSYQPKPAELNDFIKNTYNDLHGIVEEVKSLNENDAKDIKQNFVLEKLAAAGIEVVTDKDEFDRILNQEKILQKMAEENKIEDLFVSENDENLESEIDKLTIKDVNVYNKYINISKETPFILKEFGLENYPVNIYKQKLARALFLEKEKYGERLTHGHKGEFTDKEVKEVFKNIGNPRYIFNSKQDISKPEHFYLIGVYDVFDKQGNPMMLSFHFNKNRKEVEANWITAVYGKSLNILVNDWVRKGFLQYKNDLEIENASEEVVALYMRVSNLQKHLNDIVKQKSDYVNENDVFFYKQNNEVYGFTHNSKIYLNPEIMNSEVAVHEYTHLWDNYTQRTNPELWQKGKDIFKNTKFWADVKADPNYADIAENDDLLSSEVHAQICGKMADAILTKIAERDGELTKDTIIDWDNEVWDYMQKELGFSSSITQSVFNTQDVKEFLSTPMKDLMNGIQITKTQQQNEIIENTSPAQKPEKNIYEQTIETFSQAMNKMIETLKILPTDENIGRVSNTVLTNNPELKETLLSIMHQNGCTNAEKTMAFLHTVHQGDFDKLDLHDKKRVINNHTNSYDKDEFSISD